MWPLTEPYPEASAPDVDGQIFDYIIVGGGTAGCVLANRLSRAGNATVLVLEKGGVEESLLGSVPLLSQNYYLPQLRAVVRRSEDLASSSVPEASPFSSGRPWLAAEDGNAHGGGSAKRKSGVKRMGKRIIVRTKEAVGGATRINAMLHTRGFPGGYELWRRALEQPASAENETQDGPPHPPIRDWSWAAVEPIFQQLENATRVNARLRVSDSTPASTSSSSSPRGTSGEVSVGRHAYPWRHYSYWERSAQALNLPVVTDLNDPAAPSMGYAHLDHLVDDRGFRASAYSMFLPKAVALERKRWLTVCTNVVATGLKFADGDSDERGREADGERIVTGVHVKMNGSSDGRTFFIRARREVIVCCGTICTPQLLMLSGIGDPAELSSHKIACRMALPTVGANLTDHVAVPILLSVPLQETVHWMQLLSPLVALWHLLLYLVLRRGILAAPSTAHVLYLRSSLLRPSRDMTMPPLDDLHAREYDGHDPAMLPDLEIMLQPASSMEGVDGLLSDGGLHGLGGLLYVIVAALLPLQWLLALRRRLPWLARLQPLGVMSLHVALVQPTARGRVGLRDGEDSQHPRIEYPDVGACPEDMTALRAGVRFALRLSEELAVRSGYPFATDTSLLLAPGVDNLRSGQRYHLQRDTTDMQGTWRPEWRFDAASDATVDEYVREHACSALHVSGTARMARSQADGVVDSELRVFGTANLRIADASVFPEIPAAHTMAPTLLVAERCARFIMEKWEEKKDV